MSQYIEREADLMDLRYYSGDRMVWGANARSLRSSGGLDARLTPGGDSAESIDLVRQMPELSDLRSR